MMATTIRRLSNWCSLSLFPQDVFILQLDGRKEWRLYDVPVKHPFMGHKVGRVPQGEPPAQAGRPRMTLTLEPGDMLYMPRGLVHEAATTDAAPSLHLTITADTQSASVAPFLGFMIHAATHEDRDRMSQVIPTPLHVLGRISPILSPFFPFFARFHRLAETVPTSPKPEPRAKKQPARRLILAVRRRWVVPSSSLLLLPS